MRTSSEPSENQSPNLSYVVVTIFGYGVKPSEMNKPRMCNIAHVLANKLKA